jgi:hypothetical protein
MKENRLAKAKKEERKTKRNEHREYGGIRDRKRGNKGRYKVSNLHVKKFYVKNKQCLDKKGKKAVGTEEGRIALGKDQTFRGDVKRAFS